MLAGGDVGQMEGDISDTGGHTNEDTGDEGIDVAEAEMEPDERVVMGAEQKRVGADQLDRVEKAWTEFTDFRGIVDEDLKEKINSLSEFRNTEARKRSDRHYANLQIFMLRTYLKRINSFQHSLSLVKADLEKVITSGRTGNEVEKEIEHFQNLGSRLKTRVKHILDVSEKYATMHIFDQLCDVVDETHGEKPHNIPDYNSLKRLHHSQSMEMLSSTDKSISTTSLPVPISTDTHGDAIITTSPDTRTSNHLYPPTERFGLSASPSSSISSTASSSASESYMAVRRSSQPKLQGKRSLQLSSRLLLRSTSSTPPTTVNNNRRKSPSPVPSLNSPTPPSSPDSGSMVAPPMMTGTTDEPYRKRASSFQSLTQHLAVLRKTYTNRR